MKRAEKAERIRKILDEFYPALDVALDHRDPFTLLVAVLLSAFIYVLPQIAFRSPLLVVVALLCGLVWGALRVWTKSLVAPLAAHLLWDLLVFVLFPVG